MAGTSLLTALAGFALAEATGHHLLNGTVSKWLPWILAWATCTALLRMVSELARGYELLGFSYLVGGQSGGFGVNGILILSALAAGMTGGLSLQGILWIQVTVQLFCLIFGLVVILRVSTLNRPSEASGTQQVTVPQMLYSSLPILVQQLVAFGLPEADTMMLASYASVEDIALYGAAKKLVFLAVVPLLLINHAIQPFITEFYARRNTGQLATLVRGTATFAAIPSLFVVLTLLIAPELILQTCFGDTYTAAAGSLRILCCGTAVFVLTGSCGLVLTMTGHEHAGMWSSLIAGILYLLAAPYLIAGYGIQGAAISTVCLQFSTNISAMLLAYFHERIWTGITFSGTRVIACFRLIFPRKTIEEAQNI